MMTMILGSKSSSSCRLGAAVFLKPRNNPFHYNCYGSNRYPTTRKSTIQRRTFFSRGGGQQQQQQQQQQQSHSRHSHNSSFFKFERDDPGLRWTSVVSGNNSDDSDQTKKKKHKTLTGGQLPGIPSRAEQIQALRDSNHWTKEDDNSDDVYYDLLVIGGGCTGAGIALDAATRGLHVACIERGDFASETSSRSTKLIWAGLKYLGTAMAGFLSPRKVWHKGIAASWEELVSELKMVIHCHQERHYMITRNKHLCHWIPIAIPFYHWTFFWEPQGPPMGHFLLGIFPMVAPMVLKIYDALSGFSCPPSYIMGRNATAKYFPQLDLQKLKYCAVFYEAQHNDARTNLAIALTAASKGAHIVNYVAAIDLIKDNDSNNKYTSGRVLGAVVLDRMTYTQFQIKAKHVVFAGGPFTDQLRKMEEQPGNNNEVKPAVRGAHGTHVVLSGHLTPQHKRGAGTTNMAMGLLDPNTSDGRFLFILPWLGHTLAGTTDVKSTAQTLPTPPKSDVEWILREASKHYAPEHQSEFQTDKVLSAWRGWRPLAVDPHAPNHGPVSRDHVISQHPISRCWFVAGGKWTTWREMAQAVVDQLTPVKCTTLEFPLWGGSAAEGYSDDLVEQVQANYPKLDVDIVQHLVDTYGGRVWHVLELTGSDQRLVPDFPYVEAEVVYACREYACTVEDVLSRRTRLAFLNQEAAMQALPRVAELMQTELQWTKAVKQAQMQAAAVYLESYKIPPLQQPQREHTSTDTVGVDQTNNGSVKPLVWPTA